MGCCKGVVNVEIEERCQASDKMRLDQFFAFVVDIFLRAESQVVENKDLTRLDLCYFLDGMRTDDVIYELDLLRAILREET